MELNKYSISKNGTTIGAYKSGSSKGSGGGSTTTKVKATLDREIWGQGDDGGDVNGDLTCEGNLFVVDNWNDGEEDDEADEVSYIGAQMKPIPVAPLSIADDLTSKFDNDEGGNQYVKRQLVVDGDIKTPQTYSKTVYLDYNSTKTNILDLLLPVGAIIMYDGKTAIPSGWAICNGSNGTPDLRGKFIKGVGTSGEVGATGGNTEVTLSVNNLPSHNHSAETTINLNIGNDADGTPTDVANKLIPALDTIQEEYYDTGGSSNALMYTGSHKGDYGLVGIKVSDLVGYAGGASGSASATTTIGNTGEGTAINIEPPYYSLIYIMKIS